MVLRLKIIGISFLFVVCLACAPSPRFYLQYGNRFSQSDLETILAANPLSATENIRITTLGESKDASHHVVQIRDREAPHIHKERDATVVLLKGQGYLMLERRRIELVTGDVLFIPRGAVHYFVNTFGEPSVALAVFTPPFDGKDTVRVEQP